MQERTCVRCGAPVVAKRRDAIYCGKACKKKAQKRRAYQRVARSRWHPRPCATCGAQFMAGTVQAKYCGRACQRKAERQRWRERNPQEHARRARAKSQRSAARAASLRANAYRTSLTNDPCAYCGSPGGSLDHIDAKDRGGSDADDNLTGACHDCNSRKWTTPLLRFLLVQRIEEELQPLEVERVRALAA